MQIFKALQPISVLSFDLDDTLYDNKPVIAAAEAAMLKSLAQHAPVTRGYNSDFWWQQRLLLAKATPEIRHDLGRWRLLGIEAGLVSLGLNQCEAGEIAEVAYSVFWQERTNVKIKPEVKALLTALASRYQLIAITNGNACIKKMGLGNVFEFSLQAGPDGRMKPYPDLFLTAAQRLKINPNAILHIGDSHRADIMGALNAGCQAAWLDHYQQQVNILPHLWLTHLRDLIMLVSAD